MEFKPKKVICKANGDSFKYTCKNIHLDEKGHENNNTYRFNRGVPYLVKNQEDYDELISLEMFEAYGPEEKEETKKEKKAREKAEKEANAETPEVEEILENKDIVPEVE